MNADQTDERGSDRGVTAPHRIAHYELVDPIGRDGATEIYRARDLRLGREVAIKLLRPEEIADPAALERFRREARIASLVSHPHICAVHDSGEEGGQPFLVCELLEGRALDEAIAGTPLSMDRLLDIAIQVTDALAAAHRRGIVHGNLKPSNVFLTTDGHVKLLELGVATAATAAEDRSHVDSSGTTATNVPRPAPAPAGEFFHPYLSPEQVAGRGADHRSDIFAAGALLYEMATATRAFHADTLAKVAAAIAMREPPPPGSVNPRVPPAIDSIIERALDKDPARRYQSASDLLADLRRARRAIDPSEPITTRPRFAAPFGALGVAASVTLIAAALVAVIGSALWWRRSQPIPAMERSAVLVSDIANGTADPDFDGTLRQAVAVYLAQSPYLNLVSDERVRSTLQLMGRDPNARMTHDVAAEVCQRLRLNAMLEGSVSAVGRVTVVALVATDCGTGAVIDRQHVEVERKEDVLRAVGPITASLRTALGESRASLARHNVPIEEATTPSLEALKAYTEAASRRAAGAEFDAIPFLERAISLDPRFALAYATLSTVYGGLGETGRSEEFARLAYENREHVSERERLFITYQYHDRVTGNQLKAREALEVWKRTYPRDYRAPNALAVLLNRLGDYDGAVTEAEEAMRRNPAHAFPYSNLAYAHRGAGRYTQARTIAEQAMERKLETLPLRRLLYQLAEIDNDENAARVQLDWASGDRRSFDVTGARAQVLAFRGRMTEARILYRDASAAAAELGLSQIGSGYAAQAALTEALFGYRPQAVDQARGVIRSSTAFEPQLRAATALALAGAPDEAEAVVRRLRTVRPDDTLLHAAYLPVAEAAVLLRRGRSEAAIEELRRAAQYERGFIAVLAPAYLRGEARLRVGAADEAVRDFQSVLDNRGVDPFSPLMRMSQLGLARALARNGNAAASRDAYDALLREWTAADPSLPILREAQTEVAKMR